MRCPICEAPAGPRSGNPAAPFCSERCRLIDLGRWLDGDYRIPGSPAAVPEEVPGQEEDPEWPGYS
ncbi:MAG: DNA gyrase inhibitor YacG [Deltaproteobacteria bacterium]|nr:DNA gyrase inhibitor YacG [Deltaproteobacteria bacterium]